MRVGGNADSLGRLQLYGTELREVREVKYLGLMIKYDCTWGLHWKYVKEKARRASFAVTRFGGRIRLNVLAMVSIVKAVVRAILFYGVPVWAPPKEACFAKMDEMVVTPVALALGMPRQAGKLAVMVETALTPSDIFWDYLCLSVVRRMLRGKVENPAVALVKPKEAMRGKEERRGGTVGRVVAALCRSWGINIARVGVGTLKKERTAQFRKRVKLRFRYDVRVPAPYLALSRDIVRAIVRFRVGFGPDRVSLRRRRLLGGDAEVNCRYCEATVEDAGQLFHRC